MKRKDNVVWLEARKHAESVSAKWDLKTARSCFVAEYTERVWLAKERDRQYTIIHHLSGMVGALKKRVADLEKGGAK